MERTLLDVPGVDRVHDVHAWTVTSGLLAMSGHAVVPDLGEHPTVLDELTARMRQIGFDHVTIQLETGGPYGDFGDVRVAERGPPGRRTCGPTTPHGPPGSLPVTSTPRCCRRH